MPVADMSVGEFIAALAARQPTPAGGAAAALSGCQAAALLGMVCRFTIDNPRYAAVAAEMRAYLAQSDALTAELLVLSDRDIATFDAVVACYRMPRADDAAKAARSTAIQAALKEAVVIPYTIAQQCLHVIQLVVPIATNGNRTAVGDAVTALYLATAGLHSSLSNVNVNLRSIKDVDFVRVWLANRATLLDETAVAYQNAKQACEDTLGITFDPCTLKN